MALAATILIAIIGILAIVKVARAFNLEPKLTPAQQRAAQWQNTK